MGIPKKGLFVPVLVIAICFLALCVTFSWSQIFPPYLRDATTALATAMIGGVAAGAYLNVIGLRDQKSK